VPGWDGGIAAVPGLGLHWLSVRLWRFVIQTGAVLAGKCVGCKVVGDRPKAGHDTLASANWRETGHRKVIWAGQYSAFRRGRGDGDITGFRLVTKTGGAWLASLIGVVRVALTMTIVVALETIILLIVSSLIRMRVLLLGRLSVLLTLLLGLVHGVQDTKVMFCVLEEGLRGNPVSTAGCIATQL
jgi:hypothetical protein